MLKIGLGGIELFIRTAYFTLIVFLLITVIVGLLSNLLKFSVIVATIASFVFFFVYFYLNRFSIAFTDDGKVIVKLVKRYKVTPTSLIVLNYYYILLKTKSTQFTEISVPLWAYLFLRHFRNLSNFVEDFDLISPPFKITKDQANYIEKFCKKYDIPFEIIK